MLAWQAHKRRELKASKRSKRQKRRRRKSSSSEGSSSEDRSDGEEAKREGRRRRKTSGGVGRAPAEGAGHNSMSSGEESAGGREGAAEEFEEFFKGLFE